MKDSLHVQIQVRQPFLLFLWEERSLMGGTGK
jgi:hypothetical protein